MTPNPFPLSAESGLKKHLPWLLPLVCLLPLLLAFRPESPSRGFDVTRVGRLPVLQNGRLKPLDTVARSTLLMLRGKQTLRDGGQRIGAMEWLWEVLARPEAADHRPLFLVQDPDVLGFLGAGTATKKYFSFHELLPHLGEVESHAAQAEQLEAPQRSRFQTAVLNLQHRLILYQQLRITLLPPNTEDFSADLASYEQVLGPGLKALADHQSSAGFDRQALERLGGHVQRYEFTSQFAAFFPLTPPAGSRPDHWINMGQGLLAPIRGGNMPPDVPAYARLLDAYRKDDAGAFHRAAADLEEVLRSRAPQAVSRARAEALFNRVEPFYQGMVLYVIVFLLSAGSWLAWPGTLQKTAFRLLLVAFAVHTAGLAARVVLQGRPPVTNLYSSAVFVGWAAVLLGIVLERLYNRGFGSLVSAGVGFATLIVAHHLTGQGDTMEMMRAVLDSNFWLATHVVTITIGYSSTFLAGALAHVYIFRGVFSKSFTREQAGVIAKMTYGVVCFSLLFSFLGTILGGIWADQSWGRFWGWDPKENGALLIFLWNALILHALWGRYAEEKGLMVMAVFGNIITSLSWFGVNMLGIGLHSYGFMDKAFWALFAFVASQAAVMALAFLPAHRWQGLKEA